MAARGAARVLVALGPVGIAIAIAVAAAVAIGVVVYYYVNNKDKHTIPEAVEQAIDDSLPTDPPSESPDKDVPEKVLDDPWLGHIPWSRRPGRELVLSEVLSLHPTLRSLAIAA